MHDLEVENLVKGTRTWEDNNLLHPGLLRKIRKQALKANYCSRPWPDRRSR